MARVIGLFVLLIVVVVGLTFAVYNADPVDLNYGVYRLKIFWPKNLISGSLGKNTSA